MHTICHPSATDAFLFIRKHHIIKPEKTMILMLGECMVDYHGRARSLLDWGERLIIIKQDGTVLVHQPVMREPVNWQPSGTITEFNIQNNYFNLNCRHIHPVEKMNISFRHLKLITVASLIDHATLILAGMEIDVVNQIHSNPSMIEEGLRIVKREKQVKTGSIDLYALDKNHIPVVIEVKRSIATISSVHQLRMYVKDVKKDRKESKVRGILCAPRVPDMVKKLLEEQELEWKEVKRKVILPDNRQRTLTDF